MHQAELKPKALIDIGNGPILSHQLRHYAENGFKQYVFCILSMCFVCVCVWFQRVCISFHGFVPSLFLQKSSIYDMRCQHM